MHRTFSTTDGTLQPGWLPQDELLYRNEPERDFAQLGMTTRSTPTFGERASSINEQERSIDGVLATEDAVTVWDWQAWEAIDEVLRMDGCRSVQQIPLLDNHSRWSCDNQIGSTRNIRVEGDQLVGRNFFADDDISDRTWKKVKGRHLESTSVGYRVYAYTDIAAGQTATVNGKQYTAGQRRLRVSTDWEPKENSVTPIGADGRAKMRSAHQQGKDGSMNPKLRKFLETIGLRTDASDAQAQEFFRNLGQADRARAEAAANAPDIPPVATNPPPQDGQRTEPPATGPPAPPPQQQQRQEPTPPPADPMQRERERVRQITELAGDDVPRDMMNRALNEGWDVARASTEFIGAIRGARGNRGGEPWQGGIHARDRQGETNARTIAAGLLYSQGLNPTLHRSHDGNRPVGARFSEHEAELGEQFSRMSAIDIARVCAQVDTGRFHMDPNDAIRAAMSGATLLNVFTTNGYARLINGWERAGDTTQGWVDEEDLPNFLEHEDISLQMNAALDEHPRGGEAKHATMSDSSEPIRIARYSKQFNADEQDFIDDRLGAIMKMPDEMGEQARETRPNLVYALILRNPSLTDGGAVFNATAVTTVGGHANLGTGVLNSDNLQAAITAMGMQRENNRVLNLTPRVLIVPKSLEWKGDELLSPAMIARLFALNGDARATTENLIARKNLKLVIDDRVGLAGVMDPTNKNQVRAGTNTNWFLAAGGTRSIRVAYRRGTGRLPQMRAYTLTKGKWGMGWDINFDIGAAFMAYQTWYKSTGAG